jgi:hypothetical protein
MAKHPLTRLDSKAILEEAAQTGQIYKLKAGWRRFQTFAGLLLCLLILTLPLGIWFIVTVRNAKVGLSKDGFTLKALGTRTWAWCDIESFSVGHTHTRLNIGGGLVGALVGAAVSSAIAARSEGLRGPIYITLKGRRFPQMFPAHLIERSIAMAEEMERLSGRPIFPRAPSPWADQSSPARGST